MRLRNAQLLELFSRNEEIVGLTKSWIKTADDIAEKIRASVAALKIQTSGGLLQKTISIGISSYPGDSEISQSRSARIASQITSSNVPLKLPRR